MRRLIPRTLLGKVVGIVGSALVLAGAISGILTYLGAPSPFDYWPSSNDTNEPNAVSALAPTPPPSPTPTATPFPTLTPGSWPLPAEGTPTSLDDLLLMLAAAKSTQGFTAQAEALRDVAKYAVVMGYYGIAIEAGRETDRYSDSAKTLSDVAICAAEAGRHREAFRAANEIDSIDTHDFTVKTIVYLQGEQVRGGEVAEPTCPWVSSSTPPVP